MLELMGMTKWAIGSFEYGERWRTYRRLFHELFNLATVDRYDEDQSKDSSKLLKNLSEHPVDFRRHLQLATGSLALKIIYGIEVESPENPYFLAAEGVVEAVEAAMIPGAFPVEFLPFRKFPQLYPNIVYKGWSPGQFAIFHHGFPEVVPVVMENTSTRPQ